MPDTDRETVLIRRLRANDQSAYEDLASRYSERLKREVFHFVRNPQDADDVVQQTLCQAWRHFGQYRGEAGLYSWLTSIARNESRIVIRKRSRNLISLDDPNAPWLEAEIAAVRHRFLSTPEQLVQHVEVAFALRQCLKSFQPITCRIMKLRWDGDSFAEIGSGLHISTHAAKLRFLRGRKKLREMLTAELCGSRQPHWRPSEISSRGQPNNRSFSG